MNSLTVGNVVSAGLKIYFENWKKYFLIALQGYLWIFIPIYGWAKFAEMNGLLARLAFGEISENPETETEARRYTKPRLWTFFSSSLLVSLIFVAGFIGFFIAFFVIIAVMVAILGIDDGGNNVSPIYLVFIGLFTLVSFLVLLIGMTWLIARFLLVELPIAIEEGVDAGSALGRSWNLTKGSVIRIQLIVFVAFLITAPVSGAIQIASAVVQVIIASLAGSNYQILSSLLTIFILALGIAGGALLIPFWQAIKAVIYYDLRIRREGFGIDLEKNN